MDVGQERAEKSDGVTCRVNRSLIDDERLINDRRFERGFEYARRHAL